MRIPRFLKGFFFRPVAAGSMNALLAVAFQGSPYTHGVKCRSPQLLVKFWGKKLAGWQRALRNMRDHVFRQLHF